MTFMNLLEIYTPTGKKKKMSPFLLELYLRYLQMLPGIYAKIWQEMGA